MSDNQLRYIKCSTEVIPDSYKQLRGFEFGFNKPIVTEVHHFNDNTFGGVLPSNIIVIGGTSGTGKSFFLQRLERNFLDQNLNPHKGRHILLRLNWEMIYRSLLVRSIRQQTKMKVKDIYYKTKTEEEQKIIEQIISQEINPDIFYLSKPLTPTDLYMELYKFLWAFRDAERIWISLDHAGMVKGHDKTKAMNELIEVLNELKLDPNFSNVSFMIVTQLNRNIDDRTDFRHLAPKKSDLYGADLVFQIADLVLILNRPERFYFDKYMDVAPKKYPHLAEFMVNVKADKTAFNTSNLLFYHYLKIREDDPEMDSLYIERLDAKEIKQIELVQDLKKNIAEQFNEDMSKTDIPF